MFHPDPKVRMALTRRLPELPGVNPVPWLLELSRDDDAEVRRSAISLMATTGDPALLKRIQTMARKDRDPWVQRQADRLAGRPKELR
jgi:HEAT repeat protein